MDGRVILITGPAGAGKSTVGRALADALGWQFVDADDLHLPASVEKMRRGTGLSEADRWPWLERVRNTMEAAMRAQRPLVLACSALREAHRRFLLAAPGQVEVVFLHAPRALLESRLRQRTGHFAAAGLLDSQLEALEPPGDALALDAALPVPELVGRLRSSLRTLRG